MSDRSKNILATAALIGMAAIASSSILTAPQGPRPVQTVAQAPIQPLVMASLND